MPETGEGESPRELTPQRTAHHEAGNATNNPFALVMEREVFGKLSQTPAGEDPAYYPITVLNEFNYMIVNREDIKNNPGGLPYAEFGEYAAPMKETIRKVKTAYEILAYPHCKDWGRRDNIASELERDRQSFERDEVELNDEELRALSKLTVARKIPFDPQKRVYKYTEVLGTPESK
jgi:hypothetical protein